MTTSPDPQTFDDPAERQGSGAFGTVTLLCLGGAGAVLLLVAKAGFFAAAISAMCVLLFASCLNEPYRSEMRRPAVLIAFFMSAIAWTLPNVWLLYIAMAVWVPVFARRIEQVAGVYLFSLLLLPGLDTTVALGGTKLFDMGVHDALALGAAYAILRDPARNRIAGGDDLRVGLLLAILIAASARDTSLTHFMRSIINTVVDYGLPYYILSRGLVGAEAMRSAMRWFACGGMALAGMLCFEVWRRWPIYNELYPHYGIPTAYYVKMRGVLVRAGGPFMEATSVALVMALCLVALWLLSADFRSRTRHGVLCVILFLGGAAPQSRNGWVALGIAILCAEAVMGRWRALCTKLVAAGLGVGLILAAAGVSQDFSDSLGLTGDATGTADYRRDLFDRGREEFWKSPVIGFSNAELEWRMNDMRQGEGIIDYVNSYLWFALIAGVIGLFAFAWNLFAPLAWLWNARHRIYAADTVEPVAFVFGSIATLSVALFFTSFGMRTAVLTVGLMGFMAALRMVMWRAVPAGYGDVPPVDAQGGDCGDWGVSAARLT